MTAFLNFIDGAFVKGEQESFANHFPTIGEVRAARAALKGPWGKLSVPERVGLLRKLRLPQARRSRLVSQRSGKPTIWSEWK